MDIVSRYVSLPPHPIDDLPVGGEGTAPTYAPTVVRLEDGERIEERLAHWSDEDKARRLARWLSGKLGPSG